MVAAFDRLPIALLTRIIRIILLRCAHTFGVRLKDQRTGESLGRVLIIPFRGKLWIIGLTASVRPEFLPQRRTTYWKQDLGFSTHPDPDFPSINRTGVSQGSAGRGPND